MALLLQSKQINTNYQSYSVYRNKLTGHVFDLKCFSFYLSLDPTYDPLMISPMMYEKMSLTTVLLEHLLELVKTDVFIITNKDAARGLKT